MQGKKPAIASLALARVLDKYGKTALIDLVADRARAELGENASDRDVMGLVMRWMVPVSAVRGDRAVDLLALDSRYTENDERYRRERLSYDGGREFPSYDAGS